jgi:hypothetical protein
MDKTMLVVLKVEWSDSSRLKTIKINNDIFYIFSTGLRGL